jgi:CubicO group peptidase (beta-lactamase class C family)
MALVMSSPVDLSAQEQDITRSSPGKTTAERHVENPGLAIRLTVPKNTPKDAAIYVAGSFNHWQTNAADYRLAAAEDGQYEITLPSSVRGKIEFKFTLGSWDRAELDAAGAETSNRSFVVPDAPATYSGAVQAWHMPSATIDQLKKELENILADTHTPGMSIAIVRQDGPEWIAGLGKSDVARDRPATADTLFRIGSISKAFAALAILKLENQGKLSLQDPVRKLAPEIWFENRWEATDPVRVVDLLEHTTGWDDLKLNEYAKDAPGMKLGDAFEYSHRSRISRWRPGTRMSYCNSGPAVAAFIVEKITGQRFEDYVAQNFFMPIGMKRATYFQPGSDDITKLYHTDGKTPHPYWNIIFRPAGSINASANDMAAYLSFYLHRGAANDVSVMPAASIDRMEVPTRSWGAREGLSIGYGLYNTAFVQDGLLYRGHDGGLDGALSMLAYMPDHGVGFFFSINTNRGDTFEKVHQAIRGYVTRGLLKLQVPQSARLSEAAERYSGWYEPASPRAEAIRFLERLTGIGYVGVDGGNLVVRTLGGKQTLTPVADKNTSPEPGSIASTTLVSHPSLTVENRTIASTRFRSESDPVATTVLVAPNSEGTFIVNGTSTIRRIPAWLALSEIGLTAWFALALASTVLYAPFWLLAGLNRKWRRPQERWIKIWPLTAALCFISISAIFYIVREDLIVSLGNLTVWSIGMYLATIAFAAAAMAGGVALWMARKAEVRKYVFGYLTWVTLAFVFASMYSAYWGFVGIRTWA